MPSLLTVHLGDTAVLSDVFIQRGKIKDSAVRQEKRDRHINSRIAFMEKTLPVNYSFVGSYLSRKKDDV